MNIPSVAIVTAAVVVIHLQSLFACLAPLPELQIKQTNKQTHTQTIISLC